MNAFFLATNNGWLEYLIEEKIRTMEILKYIFCQHLRMYLYQKK